MIPYRLRLLLPEGEGGLVFAVLPPKFPGTGTFARIGATGMFTGVGSVGVFERIGMTGVLERGDQ